MSGSTGDKKDSAATEATQADVNEAEQKKSAATPEDVKDAEPQDTKAHDSGDTEPIGAIRGDVRPVEVDETFTGTTKEKVADEKRRAALIEEPEDTHPTGKKAPTTDHIPNYGQTHATPGVPFSENPLNPGVNPAIIPGPGPR